jgi:hypothetical protein
VGAGAVIVTTIAVAGHTSTTEAAGKVVVTAVAGKCAGGMR